jgi:hypothetical protein
LAYTIKYIAIKTGSEKMEKYDLVAPCGDYCSGCGQYNGLISETAKQMREFADLYGFEFRSEGAFDFKQFVKGLQWFKRFKEIGFEKWVEEQIQKIKEGYEIHLQKVASLKS